MDGTIFNGSANAKKQAKQRAAEAALLTLCPSILAPPTAGVDIDFTKDSNTNVEMSHGELVDSLKIIMLWFILYFLLLYMNV